MQRARLRWGKQWPHLETGALTGRLIAEMRGGLGAGSSPAELEGKRLVALHQLLHEAKFRDPSGDHLSPAGARARASFPEHHRH